LSLGRGGDDLALESLQAAPHDDAWRVREMALRVVARHRLDDLLPTVLNLQEDPVLPGASGCFTGVDADRRAGTMTDIRATKSWY
jgi:hypothetical protein